MGEVNRFDPNVSIIAILGAEVLGLEVLSLCYCVAPVELIHRSYPLEFAFFLYHYSPGWEQDQSNR